MSRSLNINEIETYLEGVNFPTSKREILDSSKRRGVPQEIAELIEEVPDRNFSSASEFKCLLNDIIQKQLETGPR